MNSALAAVPPSPQLNEEVTCVVRLSLATAMDRSLAKSVAVHTAQSMKLSQSLSAQSVSPSESLSKPSSHVSPTLPSKKVESEAQSASTTVDVLSHPAISSVRDAGVSETPAINLNGMVSSPAVVSCAASMEKSIK